MKTCLKYWGGKQQLADRILSLIPPHTCYVEPFFGGGAVFFEKLKAPVEIINDVNDNIVNFYRVIKRDFEKLKGELDVTLYSESQWKQAKELWKNGEDKDKILRAWAVYVLSHQTFSGTFSGGWAFSTEKNRAETFKTGKDHFDKRYVQRLDGVQIFCRNALDIIAKVDAKHVFFFVDPPYFNADMGHYGGYTEEHLRQLLLLLGEINGKFLLTTYPSELLYEFTERHGWHTVDNVMHRSSGNTAGVLKNEVFTLNYPPPVQQDSLFDLQE